MGVSFMFSLLCLFGLLVNEQVGVLVKHTMLCGGEPRVGEGEGGKLHNGVYLPPLKAGSNVRTHTIEYEQSCVCVCV